MATHSSVLAWRIPGTAEPGGLPSMGSHRVGYDWSDLAAAAAAALQLACILPPRVLGKCLHSLPPPPIPPRLQPLGPLQRGLVTKFQTALSLAQEAVFPLWGQQMGGHPGVWLHLGSQSPRICRLPVPLLPARQPWCHVALDRRCSAPDPLSGRKCN